MSTPPTTCPTCGSVLAAKHVFADLELDLVTHRVKRAGLDIALTPREFQLLEYLMRNAGRVVARTMVIRNAWKFLLEEVSANEVDVYVNYLRKKISLPSCRGLIHTVRGVGYRFGEE